MTVRARVATMADIREQMADFGRTLGPAPRQESREIGRCARLRHHHTDFRQLYATHPTVDASRAKAELPGNFGDGATSVIQGSDFIEHRPAGSVAPATHRAFPCGGLRARGRLFGNRLLHRVPIVLDVNWSRPDRRLEATKLVFDGLAQVLQQVEAIGDLASLRCALTGGVSISAGAIAADNLSLGVLREPVRCCCRRAVAK